MDEDLSLPAPNGLDIYTPEAFAYLYDPPLGAVRYRVAYGGRGSAKSWQKARALLIHGLARPLRILCGREFQSSIRESVHHLLQDQIFKLGLSRHYKVTDREIIGSNGTQFIFKGMRRDPNGIRSLEAIDIAWIEEAHAVSESSWQVLIPTIRKPGSEIWVSFNPVDALDATYLRFVVNPPPRAIIRKVGYLDNPWLPAVLLEEAETLRARDPDAYAHVWGGEPWTRTDTQILAGLIAIDEIDEARSEGEGWDGPYFGADWGFARDPTVLVKLWRGNDRLYLPFEAGGVGLNNDQTAESFRKIPGAEQHLIRADAARPETINEIRRRGFRIESAPKWSGSVEDGIAHLRGYTQIVIDPRCTRAQLEARLYRYATNDAGDVLPKIIDRFNHTWDAARYGLSPFIRQRQGPRILNYAD